MIGKLKDTFYEVLGYLFAVVLAIVIAIIGLIMLGTLIRLVLFLWEPIIKLLL